MVNKRREHGLSGTTRPGNSNFTFSRSALSLAVAAALPGAMSLPSVAYAQEEADNEFIEEVVTYGAYRRSLVDAIDTKRDATSVVEALSAEEIGKLPDSSIAESLARLPGLAGERRNGRTSGLSVRGFREDYVGTTMNGRELLGIGDNRGVEYDLYPSEIISGVVVYKTPQANQVLQGIGGVVDLRTTRPLDSSPYFVINANYEQNEFESANPDFDDTGHRLALSFSNTFADDKLGLAFAVATTDSPSQEEYFRGWGYPTADPANAAPGVALDGSEAILGGHDSYVRSAELQRDTFTGVLQFAPTDTLTLTFDALYIDFQDDRVFRGVEEGGAVWGTGDYTVTGVDSGLVTDGYYDGFLSVIRNDAERNQSELSTFGFNADWEVSDSWSVGFDGAYSESEKTITNIETYSGVGRPGTGNQGPATARSWQMTNTGAVYSDHPTIAPVDLTDFNTIRLAGPQAWGGGLSQVQAFQPTAEFPGVGPDQSQDGFINQPVFDEELTTIRLNASKDFGGDFLSGLEVGLYYSDRTKSKDNQGSFLTSGTWPSDGPIPEEFRAGVTDLGFLGIPGVVAYDGLGLFESGFYTATDAARLQPDRLGDTYTIDEEIYNLYAQVDFSTDISSNVTMNGNFGLQYITVNQTGAGFDSVIGEDLFVNATPVEVSDSYTDWLPSLNLNFNIGEQHIVRAALSRTQSRPRMDDMRPNTQVSFNFNLLNVTSTNPANSAWSGSAGNAKLKPLESEQIDLGYEWYFAEDGFISGAFFYKDLTNWHREGAFIGDFSQFLIPGYHQVVDEMGNVVTPATNLGIVTFREDGLTGFVRGYELQATLPLRVASEALEGLGIVASAAFNDGKLDDETPVPGLSEETYQLTVYYERGGFQARVSGTKRDKFATEVRGLSLALTPTIDRGAELVDAQISYDFSAAGYENWLGGLLISLQAQNLTDEATIQTDDDARLITQHQSFGANYILGVNYKFQ